MSLMIYHSGHDLLKTCSLLDSCFHPNIRCTERLSIIKFSWKHVDSDEAWLRFIMPAVKGLEQLPTKQSWTMESQVFFSVLAEVTQTFVHFATRSLKKTVRFFSLRVADHVRMWICGSGMIGGRFATSWHIEETELLSPLLPHFCACRWWILSHYLPGRRTGQKKWPDTPIHTRFIKSEVTQFHSLCCRFQGNFDTYTCIYILYIYI